jgi:CheY-like chemotaxis protein
MTLNEQIVLAMHDRELANQFAVLLEKAKFDVVKRHTARELLETIDAKTPAAIVLGVLLPDANGLEVCKRIKTDPGTREVKIVLVSAFKRSARFALDAKTKYLADEFLEMPVAPKDFVKALETLLGGAPAPAAAAEPPPARETRDRAPAKPAGRPAPRSEPPRPAPPANGRVEKPFEKNPPRAAAAPAERAAEKPAGSGDEAGGSVAVGEIPLTGRLGPVLLPELLLVLYQRHAVGILEVRALDEQREILVRNGVPVAIRSNFIPDEALGQLLIGQGLLDAITLERLLRQAREESRKIGELLVENNVLSAADLAALLRLQAKRKMNSAFRWKDGSYAFKAGPRDMPDGVDIAQDMLSILLSGIVRHFNMAKLEERLYLNKNSIVVRTPKPELSPQDLQISEREREVLDLVDGSRTLGDIIADADLNFVRTFQVLYLFLLFGIVRFKSGDRFFRVDEAVAHRARAEKSAMLGSLGGGPDALEPEPEAESGRNETPAFPAFLYGLFHAKANGRIVVRRGEEEEIVHLVDGMPVQVSSRQPGLLALGNLLVARGKIGPEQRDALVARARAAGRPVGEIALADGLVTPHELFEILLAQLENKLIALFGWQNAEFHFEKGPSESADIAPVKVDVNRLVSQGVKRTIPPEEAVHEIRGRSEDRPTWVGSLQDAAKVFGEPRDGRVLHLIDGRRTVRQIVEESRSDEGRAAQILVALWRLGLVNFSGS